MKFKGFFIELCDNEVMCRCIVSAIEHSYIIDSDEAYYMITCTSCGESIEGYYKSEFEEKRKKSIQWPVA